MADNKTVTQTLKLDAKEFIGPLNEVRSATKSMTDDVGKNLNHNSQAFLQNETQVKKWGSTVSNELKKAGHAALENLKTGAKALTLGAGSALIKTSASAAIDDAVESSQKLAEVRARFSASTAQVEKWSDAINKAAVNSKTSISAMTNVLSELADSVDDPSKIIEFMDSIGQATSMNGGNSKGVTDFLKKDITGQGKDFNKENVDASLEAANLLQRNGKGFTHEADAMAAINSLDSNAVKSSGLNPKQIASLLAGASKSGVGGDVAVAGVQGLLGEITKGDQSIFSSLLGIGSLKDKDGKLNLSNLGKGNAALDSLGNDEDSRRKRFGEISGMGDKEAQGAFAFIRQNQAFGEAMAKAEKDTKSFSTSFKEASNNLKDNMQGLQTKIEVGLDDIFKGFKEPLNNLIQGNFGAAGKGLGHGLYQAGSGMLDHPGLVAGAALTVMGGGALLTSLLSKMGGGNPLALAGGIATGKALEKAGITPVYVTNAAEIGGGGAGAAVSNALPFLAKFAKLAKIGTGAAVVASSAIGAYSEYKDAKNDDERHLAIEKGVGGAAGGLGGMWAGAAAGAAIGSIIPGVGTAVGGIVGGAIGAWGGEAIAQKVIVEVHSKDPLFSTLPKSTDNTRSTRPQ